MTDSRSSRQRVEVVTQPAALPAPITARSVDPPRSMDDTLLLRSSRDGLG